MLPFSTQGFSKVQRTGPPIMILLDPRIKGCQCKPDTRLTGVPSAEPSAGSDFATPFVAPTEFDATPSVSSENGVPEDKFELMVR